MKRSNSLPHIPCPEPVAKRPRRAAEFQPCSKSSSLLHLSDDPLLRIFRLLLNSDKINVSSCGHLSSTIRLASTCQRLRHLFYTSIREIDATVPHARHDLPPHEHSARCTTCPALLPLPLLLQLVKRTALSLRVLRLAALDSDSTALVLSAVAANCLQLSELSVTDRSDVVARSGVFQTLAPTLRNVQVSEPCGATIAALPDGLRSLSLLSLSPEYASLVISYLRRGGRLLHSLILAFHNGHRFLPEPFAFPRFNLHRVYPDLHLDLSKGVSDVLEFLANSERAPLLQHLSLHTVGVDLNQENCDLVNCPPPVEGLDSLAGTVRLIRDATALSAKHQYPKNTAKTASRPSSLRTLDLRTDHPLLRANLSVLAPLLSARIVLTLRVNDLTLVVPPTEPDALTPSTLLPPALCAPSSKYDIIHQKNQHCDNNQLQGQIQNQNHNQQDPNFMLRHAVVSARLESLLHSDAPTLSRLSNFSGLKILHVSSTHFCVEYGRNVLAHRPRLVSLLRQAESSLSTIRVTSFLSGILPANAVVGKSLLVDVLCHAPHARVLELSDEFLITTLYHNNMTDLFLHFRNFHTIRFGGISFVPSGYEADALIGNASMVGTNTGFSQHYSSTHNNTSAAAAMSKFFHVLPVFLNLIRKSCPALKRLELFSLFPSDRAGHFRVGHSLRDANKALRSLERDLPAVDTYTVRTQLRIWATRGRGYRS